MPLLPLTITLGRPTRGELLSLAGAALLVGSAVGWATTTAHPIRSGHTADPPQGVAPLNVTSWPAGAPFSVDGQARGTTPATADVTPGQHNVEITVQDAVDETRIIDVDVSGASLQVSLWRAHPNVTYLKPPLPGATLVDATFLADGRLALQVALPEGARQAWSLEPDTHFATQRLGDATATGLLAVRLDGQAIAVLQPRAQQAPTNVSSVFSDHVRAGEVWLVPVAAGAMPQYIWTAGGPAEDLVGPGLGARWTAPDRGRPPTRECGCRAHPHPLAR